MNYTTLLQKPEYSDLLAISNINLNPAFIYTSWGQSTFYPVLQDTIWLNFCAGQNCHFKTKKQVPQGIYFDLNTFTSFLQIKRNYVFKEKLLDICLTTQIENGTHPLSTVKGTRSINQFFLNLLDQYYKFYEECNSLQISDSELTLDPSEDRNKLKFGFAPAFKKKALTFDPYSSELIQITKTMNLFYKILYVTLSGKVKDKFLLLLHRPSNKSVIERIDPKAPEYNLVPTETIERVFKTAQETAGTPTAWNTVFHKSEQVNYSRINQMTEKVYEHCKIIPNFEILDLRPVELMYLSDGPMDVTKDALNYPKVGKPVCYSTKGYGLEQEVSGGNNFGATRQPAIFCGEAWRLYFTINGKSYLGNNRVFFATNEQLLNSYNRFRPDLVENFSSFTDLVFISSDWCERNGAREKDGTGKYDLQTPLQKRLSLWGWIMGPLASKCAQEGNPINFPGMIVANGYDMRHILNK